MAKERLAGRKEKEIKNFEARHPGLIKSLEWCFKYDKALQKAIMVCEVRDCALCPHNKIKFVKA